MSTHAASRKATASPSGHPAARLKRRDLESVTTRVIHRGRGYQSSVFLVEIDGQQAAVKDVSQTPRAFRLLVAPWLLKREARVLKALRGVPFVPQFFGRVDRYAIAMQYIEGTPIADFKMGELPAEVFPRVQAAIDAIHARGVSHGDLKRRSNLLVTPQNDIMLIDFAAATIGKRRFRPFSNWLQGQMARIDDKSLPRIKKFAAPELMTEEDRFKLENPTGLERWARKLLNR